MKAKLSFLALFVVTSFSLIACQSSDSGPTVASNNYFANCQGCQGIATGNALLRSVQSRATDGSVDFSLDIYGQVGTACFQPLDKAILCAAGPASMGGLMRVRNNNSMCGAPIGDYLLRPISVSQISSATLFGGQFEAVGPGGYRILMSLEKGILFNASGTGLSLSSPANRIGISFYLNSVNGVACGILPTN